MLKDKIIFKTVIGEKFGSDPYTLYNRRTAILNIGAFVSYTNDSGNILEQLDDALVLQIEDGIIELSNALIKERNEPRLVKEVDLVW